MSDFEMGSSPAETSAETLMDEKTLLLQRAKMMGLKVSNNIGLATLKAKINAALDAERVSEADREKGESDEDASVGPVPGSAGAIKFAPPRPKTENEIRAEVTAEAMRLVRVRITCLNPNKKDLPGEIYTICNRYIGTVRKYVPFGDQTENGYHIPNCLYQHLKECRFLHIRTNAVKRDGVVVETGYVPEFAIEVLPSLTQDELKRLAIQQAVAAGQVT